MEKKTTSALQIEQCVILEFYIDLGKATVSFRMMCSIWEIQQEMYTKNSNFNIHDVIMKGCSVLVREIACICDFNKNIIITDDSKWHYIVFDSCFEKDLTHALKRRSEIWAVTNGKQDTDDRNFTEASMWFNVRLVYTKYLC